jgi:hypothetical protein
MIGALKLAAFGRQVRLDATLPGGADECLTLNGRVIDNFKTLVYTGELKDISHYYLQASL